LFLFVCRGRSSLLNQMEHHCLLNSTPTSSEQNVHEVTPPPPPSFAFSSLMFGWLVLLLCVPNHHHSNLIGVFCALGAMSCFVCFISLLHFCSCFFARVRANCLLAEAKKHHCQHLQAQCLLQDNKTFMGYSPPPPSRPTRAWSPCLIFCCLCMVDQHHSYVWSFECIHSQPHLGA
jgi:hypothetical protein